MKAKVDRSLFIEKAREFLGSNVNANVDIITRKEVLEVCSIYNLPKPNWLWNDPSIRVGRGIYMLTSESQESTPNVKQDIKKETSNSYKVDMAIPTVSQHEEMSHVPEKIRGYVPFGNFNDLRSIVKSKKFYPTYITGLSGNGKTMMVEQICALEKREMIRVNVTIETDEDDLIGGFRLINGATVWQDGPVITAMQRGSVLLLDEVDLGSNKLMCLQPVLEGKAVYLKKVNRVVHPEKGFNVIATANTKGKGSDDGRFIGTNVMNEAFLERFSITMEQEYPSSKIETKILNNVLAESGIESGDFVRHLVEWAEIIRKSFYEGALSEIISTRRLVHICEAYSIFNQNKMKAINLCLNRFDNDTRDAFMELYDKIDDSINGTGESAIVQAEQKLDEEVAF